MEGLDVAVDTALWSIWSVAAVRASLGLSLTFTLAAVALSATLARAGRVAGGRP
ncbi:MAG: hypothetical protein ACKOCN_12410 [Planctomycetaceae bacterium]